MRKLLLVLLLLAAGCANDPRVVYRTGNSKVDVSLLFSNEGYSIYRFWDAGKFHYYVVPDTDRRAMLTTFGGFNETCGKGCSTHHEDEITTIP